MSEKKTVVYPSDEFDAPAPGPVGLHRGPRSLFARALPYVVVLIVAVMCGLGVFLWLSGMGGDLLDGMPGMSTSQSASTDGKGGSGSADDADDAGSDADAQQDGQAQADGQASDGSADGQAQSDAGADASADAGQADQQDAQQQDAQADQQPAATVDHGIAITVYNGTGRTGLAAQNAATLQGAGYTNVNARNPNDPSTLPSVSTVWYQNASDLATAQDVAARLGISQVVQVSGIATPIAVALLG